MVTVIGYLLFALCGIVGSAGAAELAVSVQNDRGGPVADAVITAMPKAGVPPLKPRPESVEQIGQEFVPYVKAILMGSEVTFPNKDNVRHHVYSFSPSRRFELPLYVGMPAKPVLFDKPGVVTLGCNIHDWMIAYIYVTDTPYFSRTSADGIARLVNLPAGDYTVRVWHPLMEQLEESTARVLNADNTAGKDLMWTIKLKSDLRPRRAPVHGAHGYQ